MRLGILHSRLRADERRLIAEAEARGIEIEILDNTVLGFELERPHLNVDVIIDQSVDHHRAVYALKIADDWGIPTVNRHGVVEVYGNRLLTSMALRDKEVPTPEVRVAFTPESALEAMDEIGYPVVLKPVEGPSGQLISRIQDKYTADTILEHKKILGTYHHSIFFIQKYIEAPGYDIRAFVVDGQTVAAIAVMTNHWISPISDGGLMTNFPVTEELNDLAVRAASAVGGGVLAVDLIQTKDQWFVIEISSPSGIAAAEKITEVNISSKIIEYVMAFTKSETTQGGLK